VGHATDHPCPGQGQGPVEKGSLGDERGGEGRGREREADRVRYEEYYS